MNITKIELTNFRNYKKLKLDNFSNLNILIGKNGIGKTSVLESIYFCSLARSFKTNNENLIIKNKEEFTISKIFLYDYPVKKIIELYLDEKGKKSKINGSLQKKLSNFIAQYRVILLSPDELKIIKSSPNTRRNYLNIELSQLNKEYIKLVNDYNILIKNKNEYLKKMLINRITDERYLDIVDEKIVENGLKIYEYRKEYINQINEFITDIFKIFNKKDEVKIEYESDYNIEDKEKILKHLKKIRKKEIYLGMTSFGVHRDDIIFTYNGKNAKEFSSQGVQKLIILSMKLSEVKIFKKYYNIYPILLLDDLFSELDLSNRNKLFNSLDKDIQIFITTTDLNNINKKIINKSKVFDLNERVITNEWRIWSKWYSSFRRIRGS